MTSFAQPSFHVAVIGAGPAGLMAAETLAKGGASVTVYDQMPSAGRKLLMAGRGGLNLTHSEPFESFLTRYGVAMPVLRSVLEKFSPDALRAWCEDLGQPTFVGSSGRIFPKSLKASPLLRAWLRRLDGLGARLALRHRWKGWNPASDLLFDSPGGAVTVHADAVVLALGGASWPRLGSDGAWAETLRDRGAQVSALRPSNSGFQVAWSQTFRGRFEGTPIKGVALSAMSQTARGEIVVTREGLEGGGIYALSSSLRDRIERDGFADLTIALRPDVSPSDLMRRLSGLPRGKQSLSTFLRKALGLSPVSIALLHESAIAGGRKLSGLSVIDLAEAINTISIRLSSPTPLERAISTAGGLALSELDENLMIRRLPGVFAAGEMLDWEAPTGGYLLQASFATGLVAGQGVLEWKKNPSASLDALS
jgi:hypothetical protein